MKPFRKFVTIVTCGALGAATWTVGNSLVQDVKFARAQEQVNASRQELQKAEDLASVFRAVGKAVEPSVVLIEVKKTVKGTHSQIDPDLLKRFFPDRDGDGQPDLPEGMDPNQLGPDMEQVGEGSGVIMDTADGYGYILTNNHVAGGASEMTVTLADGREIKNAKLLGADPKSDLAVVQIKADHLITAKWGDSDTLEKGDLILAFGAPFGYVGSMTHGIVSALNRSNVGILDRNNGYENFIQVDAPINPGNSGGPLVNVKGEVVGINTAIASRSGGFQGIGFAIPTDEARPLYNELKEKGKVVRGWLGVSIADVNKVPDEAKAAGYNGDTGVFVAGTMFNTPATGKLLPGDVITQLDGKDVKGVQQLRNTIAMTAPGSDVKMHIQRKGKEQDVTVKLGEQPEDITNIASIRKHKQGGDNSDIASAESLGLRLTNLTDDNATKYSLGDAKAGAVVIGVEPGSPAAMAGVTVGDLITKVGEKDITDANGAADAIGKADPKAGVALNITNRDGSRFVFIKSQK